MIRDFREKLDIYESDLSKEISNQIADLDIKLDINAKKYNLKNMNEIIAKQKLLNKLKTKLQNNQEVYAINKNQYGGGFVTNDDITFINNNGVGNPANLIILDLQSVLKYKPNGNSFIETNALDQLETVYADNNSILHVICDDNHTYNSVIEQIPNLSKILLEENFHKVSGFLKIKDEVTKILNIYKNWIKTNTGDNKKIIYISRNWNIKRQVTELNNNNNLNLVVDQNNKNKYASDNFSIEFMEKDKISVNNNYIDQLQNIRTIRESIKKPEWLSPFLINKDHFKSLMTRLRVENGSLKKY